MDIQFQDRDLGSFFNEKYINVRIDMDGAYGQAIRDKYDVFFLPTLLILDKHGNPKYVSEGVLSSDELLSIGSYHHNAIYDPAVLASSEISFEEIEEKSVESPVQFNPFENSKPSLNPFESPINPDQKNPSDIADQNSNETSASENKEARPKEKIIYTEDQAKKNPDYLYNLTYLKLQLQDGTHWNAANDYLATQENWTTEKNMRFIFDFVRSTRSEKFKHIIENKEKYEALFSKESVNQSILIMVNLALYQRYPRPDREEALELFKLLDEDVAEVATYNYLLKRHEEEQNYHDYVLLAYDYVKNYNNEDFLIIEKMASFYEDSQVDIDIKEIIELTKAAIEIQGGTYYKLYDTLANLYYQSNNKRKALQTIKIAREVALQNNVDTYSIDRLHERIKAL